MEVTSELIARHDRPGPRYTSYPTALEFADTYTADAHASRLSEAAERVQEPVSVYVHLPFCASRCSFCACHVVITRSETLPTLYLEALSAEAATVAGMLGNRRRLTQYHWGGGTPTFYPPESLRTLFNVTAGHFDLDPGAELSVEVDPRVTTPAHLEALGELGFNRLSVGVQDVDPDVQRRIGRHQTHRQTTDLVAEARRIGLGSINLDLVYGLPGQTESSFARTLEAVLDLRPDRLAVYSFAYIPDARPHQRRIDVNGLPDRETKFALLARLVSTLTAAGYHHIGMDHFALPEDELSRAANDGTLTRNFMGYTTLRGTDLFGLGVSGISEVGGVHAQNHRRLADYLADASAGRLAIERGLVPSFNDLVRRDVITELMCNGRVDLNMVGQRFGVDAIAYFGPEIGLVASLAQEGLAEMDDAVIQATPLGRLFIRRLAMAFDAYLEPDSLPRLRAASRQRPR